MLQEESMKAKLTHYVAPFKLIVDEECMQTEEGVSLVEDEQQMMVGMKIKKKC